MWFIFHPFSCTRPFALRTVVPTLNLVHIQIVNVGLTPNGGAAVHVLRSVLEQAVAPVVVLNVVERHGLETPPAQ